MFKLFFPYWQYKKAVACKGSFRINYKDQLIRQLFHLSDYFIDSIKNVKVFIDKINRNKLTKNFLPY